jgi:SAM-dependent methyltransferase
MIRSQDAIVEGQFGPRASAYVQSAVHAAGDDLDILEAIVRRESPQRALDVGSGGGHVAYRLAPHARSVIASDLSAEMLAAVTVAAREKGLRNIETRRAPAESLPFADGNFDFLGCRFSAHHWSDMQAGLREARRVLARGATAVFIDAISPGPAALDTHLQALELLRDTSHLRNYSPSEWLMALSGAGFKVRSSRTWRLRMDFPVWIARMRTPDVNRDAICALQAAASDLVRRHYEIEPDGSFLLDTMLIEVVAD